MSKPELNAGYLLISFQVNLDIFEGNFNNPTKFGASKTNPISIIKYISPLNLAYYDPIYPQKSNIF